MLQNDSAYVYVKKNYINNFFLKQYINNMKLCQNLERVNESSSVFFILYYLEILNIFTKNI